MSFSNNLFLDEEDFPLKDPETEQRFSFSLAESAERAKKKKLLKGVTIYATPNVTPDAEILKRIIESAGGTVSSPCHYRTSYPLINI